MQLVRFAVVGVDPARPALPGRDPCLGVGALQLVVVGLDHHALRLRPRRRIVSARSLVECDRERRGGVEDGDRKSARSHVGVAYWARARLVSAEGIEPSTYW